MSMANSVRIRYSGEVLCCLDQTEVKAIEPYSHRRFAPQNLWKRMWHWIVSFYTGKPCTHGEESYEDWTRISFKDGTSMVLKMPFLEFVNGYC